MPPFSIFIQGFLAILVLVLIAVVFINRRRSQRVEQVLANTNEKLERLQVNFGRFAPDDVIEQMMSPDGGYPPSRRVVTVLFADLKGFTAMCGRMDPSDLVPLLNEYFRRMTQVILRHHGKVTELMGDGLLALFGALESNPWMARDAVMAGLGMRAAMVEYNHSLASKNQPQLEFGIGIHRGEVVAGLMGNEDMTHFGVVGDTINVASRVESLTRTHGVDLLITGSVREELDSRFQLQTMPSTMVKGVADPLETFFVAGWNENPVAEDG